MSGGHADIGPELRKLAQVILDGIDPAVRSAAALAAGANGAGKCQQAWCPVCALAAVVTGEQHPLLTIIADHSVALLDVIRAIVDGIERSDKTPPDGPPGGGLATETPAQTTAGNGTVKTRYQPIPVSVED
ncbi:hypothetical protein [Mycobacterium haemophilum]|uniref:Uncharacterized protein n=1 Tax=Mycobacterium haemophilum TaxID=29311 RepID=A0A0I9XY53_9MYCO|nr:hypothetical protein [Mycobacterium haemophilum]AKN18633.1 hypothetical protein B586_10250 [Mycobacterium haemophilum DSM 44634]KLO32102.1 hypothetical protein ABH39_08745 [Mycobacterium haemophilum]KLO36452.1 hypothetical protein ABH38_12665 [Mycobacterium haemophilum]KLO42336.1 hypothetical protein ABH37_11295 [Mycobacterium haemophilum]KLO50139.1 hypothetical protein ABH36_09215 [Mycobacterium haemophilum]